MTGTGSTTGVNRCDTLSGVNAPRTVVIAPYHSVTDEWRRANGLSWSQVIHATGSSLRGIRGPLRVVQLPGGSDRLDYLLIRRDLDVIAVGSEVTWS